MQTTSSKALLHRSPSSCQLSYRTSCSRTSTPLGRANSHSLCLSLTSLFLCISSVICCRPQRVLPWGRFCHRGHFPVRLRRQETPQPQQGVGHSGPTPERLRQQEVLLKHRDGGEERRTENKGKGLNHISCKGRDGRGERQERREAVREDKIDPQAQRCDGLTHQKCLS